MMSVSDADHHALLTVERLAGEHLAPPHGYLETTPVQLSEHTNER